ncbi:hypothetical protein HMJ29_17510 [Hymenobacter taeanensis]|uniref:Uncharacterized protein n=1 Tax=Hymenobacter taeanensis TaxID=2735321 RepID=A0A6M6BL97_9BACT|nr:MULTISPECIES: hypothetical protein [Hymenobacter]QJX48618.1 hypothetical protein HMJ29_17510 [Hymenobacter taeanensis]UOQ81883.1 hypothetical protein MUN83_03580 [Hymenobacter sp. 5414T-23]
MSTQSGKRGQHDPKAGPNANDKISNQSSEQAQQAGSTEHDRSVRSGLSGQASQPHVAAGNRPENFKDRIAGDMDSGTGMTSPSDKGGKRSNDNYELE